MHNTLVKLLIIILFICGSTVTAVSSGYNIKVKINGLEDTVCYLINYFGNTNQVKDTAKVLHDGSFIFKGTEELGGGVYIFVGQKKNIIFEFIIDKKQVMSFESDINDVIQNMKIKGSEESKLFYKYRKYAAIKEKEVNPLIKIRDKIKDNKDSTEIMQDKINAINQDVIEFKSKFIDEYPKSFVSVIFKASQDIEIPDPPLLANGKKDSTFSYIYYRKHFWDNIDLTDDRLLRTPVYAGKLKQYINKVVPQHPDTIIKEAVSLIEKTRPSKDMFKYTLWYLTNTKRWAEIMGFDAIFVYMVEKYYMTNQAFWASPSTVQNMVKRAMAIKPLLLGNIAPNIELIDTCNNMVAMYDIKASFTVVFIYDPDCGHCKKETSKLISYYNDYKDSLGIEVYAVSTDSDLNRWKKYIKDHKLTWINVSAKINPVSCNEMYKNFDPKELYNLLMPRVTNYHDVYDINSTPVIYLLDENKTIIAKKLNAEGMKSYIKKHLDNKEEE